jgi:hypothetical protein
MLVMLLFPLVRFSWLSLAANNYDSLEKCLKRGMDLVELPVEHIRPAEPRYLAGALQKP